MKSKLSGLCAFLLALALGLSGVWRGPSRQLHLEAQIQAGPPALGQPSLELSLPQINVEAHYRSPAEGQNSEDESPMACSFKGDKACLDLRFRSWSRPDHCTLTIRRPDYVSRRLRSIPLRSTDGRIEAAVAETQPLRHRRVVD